MKALEIMTPTLAEASEIATLKEGVSECLEIESYIQKLNLQNVCEFSPTLARGLGIYTGTVFEFFDREKRISSSLGGGGRYNKIITNFMDNGQEYPACGLSFGLEPIYYILSQNVAPSFVDVLIIPMGTEIESLKLAESLRNAGVKTIVELSGRKVKKAFDYANKQKIKYVMVVGENEINSALYSLKNMETGEQVSLPLEKVLEVLSK